MKYDAPLLQQRLASEYVLGTLHGLARKRFERLLARDPKLRDAVASWEQALMPMASALSVVAPSEHVWRSIEARVAPTKRAGENVGFFARFLPMRTLAPLAAGLFLGLGVSLVVPMLREAQRPGVARTQLPESYAGFLQDARGHPAVLVSSLRHGKIADVKVLHPITLPPDRVLQLWALPKNAPPLSLGLIPATDKGSITLPATSEELLSQVSELAVSVEARASAPATQPAEPFLLRGPCAKFW